MKRTVLALWYMMSYYVLYITLYYIYIYIYVREWMCFTPIIRVLWIVVVRVVVGGGIRSLI